MKKGFAFNFCSPGTALRAMKMIVVIARTKKATVRAPTPVDPTSSIVVQAVGARDCASISRIAIVTRRDNDSSIYKKSLIAT